MAANPKCGRVLRGTGGLRKLRWTIEGRGKRGGVRVIYYYVTNDERIRMIYIYRKGIKDDLNAAEKAILRKLNEDWD